MAEDLLQLLECHICSEIFDDCERKPKVLPCQHTFCLTCLKKLSKTKFNPDDNGFFRLSLITIKCPECSQEFNAPEGGVVNFINNLTMIELLRVVPHRDEEHEEDEDTTDSSDLRKCLSGRLQRLQCKLSEVAEVRARQVSRWEQEVKDTRTAIQIAFSEFHSLLEEKEKLLLRRLDDFSQTRDSVVHECMTRAYEVQLQEIVDFCSKTEELLGEKSLKVSERVISENLNKCLEIMEQLDGAEFNETDDSKWKVKFHPCGKDSLQASISMFGRLDLNGPAAISTRPKRALNKHRQIYTRGYLLAFQSKCLTRPLSLGHIPGVTLDQPEIQRIYEPASAYKHLPLSAATAITGDVETAGRRCISPTHPWLPTSKGHMGDTDPTSQMLGLNWLATLQDKIYHLLKGEPDNDQVCDMIERHTSPEQRATKEFIRMLANEFLENPGGPTAMQATLLGMSYTIPGYQVILRDRVAVLRQYIEDSTDTDLELEILYAAQAFNLQVGNPPGLLMKIFDALSDEDVVEEETFFDWLNCHDSSERAGKEVAVKATESFFAHLMDGEDTDLESPPSSASRMNPQAAGYRFFRTLAGSHSGQEV